MRSFPWWPGFLLLKKCSGGSRPEGKPRGGAAQDLASGPCKESSRMVQDIWSPLSSGFLQERARTLLHVVHAAVSPLTADECFLLLASSLSLSPLAPTESHIDGCWHRTVPRAQASPNTLKKLSIYYVTSYYPWDSNESRAANSRRKRRRPETVKGDKET